MSSYLAISPFYATGASLSATTTSQSVALPEGDQIVLTNTGTNDAYVRIDSSNVAAGAAGYLLLSRSQVTLSKPAGSTMRYVALTGTTTIHYVVGEGF